MSKPRAASWRRAAWILDRSITPSRAQVSRVLTRSTPTTERFRRFAIPTATRGCCRKLDSRRAEDLRFRFFELGVGEYAGVAQLDETFEAADRIGGRRRGRRCAR